MDDTAARQGYLRQAWLVILLACIYGGALAGVQTTLAPRIAENKRLETYGVIPRLIEGAVVENTVALTVEAADGRIHRAYKALDGEGRQLGWVLPATGQGFVDRIELLIGLDVELTRITGLYVLDQKETPGLGDLIRDEDFAARFQNAPVEPPLQVVSSEAGGAGEIRAVSGATISSWAVCEIVNKTIAELREPLLRELRTVRQPGVSQ